MATKLGPNPHSRWPTKPAPAGHKTVEVIHGCLCRTETVVPDHAPDPLHSTCGRHNRRWWSITNYHGGPTA